MKSIIFIFVAIIIFRVESNSLEVIRLNKSNGEKLISYNNGYSWMKVNGLEGGYIKIIDKRFNGEIFKSINGGYSWNKISYFETAVNNVLDVRIFPNPAHNKIQIQFSKPINSSTRIRVFNLAQEQLYDKNLKLNMGNSLEIDVENFLNGFYSLIIQYEGCYYASSFIKI